TKNVIPTISRGKLNYPSERFTFNELKNAHYVQIPLWMDEKIIYGLFRPYVSDLHQHTFPKIFFHYRKVNEEKQVKYVFIRFSHNTVDALAAYTMLRKITVKHPTTGELCDVAFNFSQVKTPQVL